MRPAPCSVPVVGAAVSMNTVAHRAAAHVGCIDTARAVAESAAPRLADLQACTRAIDALADQARACIATAATCTYPIDPKEYSE